MNSIWWTEARTHAHSTCHLDCQHTRTQVSTPLTPFQFLFNTHVHTYIYVYVYVSEQCAYTQRTSVENMGVLCWVTALLFNHKTIFNFEHLIIPQYQIKSNTYKFKKKHSNNERNINVNFRTNLWQPSRYNQIPIEPYRMHNKKKHFQQCPYIITLIEIENNSNKQIKFKSKVYFRNSKTLYLQIFQNTFQMQQSILK